MVASEGLFQSTSACISEQSVKAALDDMLYGTHSRLSNPLEELQVIEEAAIYSMLPLSPFKRSYVLSQILISIITKELCQCRSAKGTNVIPASETSHEAALEALARDAKTGWAELIIWDWLYYHYVRVDFDIAPNVFCRTASINQRSLQRYRQYGIRRLVFRLIEREQLVRENRQKRRLNAQLPSMIPLALFGREHELKFVDNFTSCLPQHIQVAGSTGVGKTTFVRSAIGSLIDKDRIDILLWIDMPKSVRELRQRLTTFIQEQGLCASIREFIQCRRTAVVIDGIEHLCNDLDELEIVLDDLGCAVVYLTSRLPIPVRNVMGFVVLSELENPDAEQLVRALLGNWHFQRNEPVAENIKAILEYAGGNPRLIEQAVWRFQMHRVSSESNFLTSYS